MCRLFERRAKARILGLQRGKTFLDRERHPLDLLLGKARRLVRVGLDLAAVEPMPVLAGEQFDTYRYKLAVIGGYHAIGQFLSNVGSLNRIIAPVTLDAFPHSVTDKTKARIKKGESLIDTKFVVQTYVARTTPLPTAEAKR